MKINILGAEYTATVKKYNEDEAFERRSIGGYCDSWTKQIVVCDMSTYKGWEHEPPETIRAAQKEILRHEIVHAFLDQSGIADSALSPDIAWAKNEEMVDWIAIQGPKIYKAWQKAGGGMKLFCKHLDKPLEFVQNITADETNMAEGKRSVWRCKDCGKIILRSTPFEQGKVSDGYHTFDELYHHRAILFSVICNAHPDLAWKSKRHHEGGGPMYNGMFIVGIETPEGQAAYHYDIDPYWDLFRVKELEYAPKWDGHTPEQAIKRIHSLSGIGGGTT